jgi:hypothetical protein
MGLPPFFQSTLRSAVTPNPVTSLPKWDFDPANISFDTLTWPNTGTMAGHDLVANSPTVVENTGGPNAKPCVLFPAHTYYDGTVDLGIVGAAARTHLIIFNAPSAHYIELMGWGIGDYHRLYDTMLYSNHVIQHFYGYEHYSTNSLRVNEWNTWLVRGKSLSATEVGLGMWLNGDYAETIANLDTAAGPLRVGSGRFSNYPTERRIARVLVWDRDLTDEEIAQVRTWVLDTYGLAC